MAFSLGVHKSVANEYDFATSLVLRPQPFMLVAPVIPWTVLWMIRTATVGCVHWASLSIHACAERREKGRPIHEFPCCDSNNGVKDLLPIRWIQALCELFRRRKHKLVWFISAKYILVISPSPLPVSTHIFAYYYEFLWNMTSFRKQFFVNLCDIFTHTLQGCFIA